SRCNMLPHRVRARSGSQYDIEGFRSARARGEAAYCSENQDTSTHAAAHGLLFSRNSARRAFTSRLTKADGTGWLRGNRIVPFEVSYPLISVRSARLTAALSGYMLVWCFQPA